MFELYIANKNYSSWSLRPWVLMRELNIGFQEHLLRFGDTPAWDRFKKISPSGKVPCLVDGTTVVWDSLAIAEYLGEHHAVWPRDATARAWARSAAAEMHSGFGELRNRCSMSCGQRVMLKEMPAALTREISRIDALWSEGLTRFGGPYLAGGSFTAADAFYAPVVFRVRSYGLALGPGGGAYAARILNLESMKSWYADALRETFRDESHEKGLLQMGTVTEDLRAS